MSEIDVVDEGIIDAHPAAVAKATRMKWWGKLIGGSRVGKPGNVETFLPIK